MRSLLLALAVLVAWPALAAEPPKKDMRDEEPIANKMKKPGMKQGDVKKDAAAKAKEMKPVLEKEEQSMERPAPKR